MFFFKISNMKKTKKTKKHKKSNGKLYYFGNSHFMSPSNRALDIPSIGWVISMNLGVVLITLSFLHRLVMLTVPMEPLSMPPMSLSCPCLHIDSMFPMFSYHLPYSLIQRKF